MRVKINYFVFGVFLFALAFPFLFIYEASQNDQMQKAKIDGGNILLDLEKRKSELSSPNLEIRELPHEVLDQEKYEYAGIIVACSGAWRPVNPIDAVH